MKYLSQSLSLLSLLGILAMSTYTPRAEAFENGNTQAISGTQALQMDSGVAHVDENGKTCESGKCCGEEGSCKSGKCCGDEGCCKGGECCGEKGCCEGECESDPDSGSFSR